MKQFSDYSDDRHKGFCVHCGGRDETRDHAPSKVFLDPPYPENLPVSPACVSCNQGFSLDEEYLACLIECVIAGDVSPGCIERPGIRRILESNVRLQDRLRNARTIREQHVIWAPEIDRVTRVLLKLARCHAAYEAGEPRLEDPDGFWFKPLVVMSPDERSTFEEASGGVAAWPEVGSRAMQRLLIAESEVFDEGWVEAQEGRYRYKVTADAELRIRIVLREYLACEVVWA